MNVTAQRACAWSGIACAAVFFLGFGIAGFISPPAPDKNADEIAEIFRDDKNQIRVGMIISMFAATLLAPFVAVISAQMRRIEGRSSVLAFTQLALGAIFVLEFIYLLMFWQAATFRSDRSPEIIQTLNDMAWIPFVGITSTAVVEALVIGFAILMDKRENPVFPRWAGYFSLWVAFMFTPGSINVFFKDGPFAWNGVFAWYIPLSVFGIWLVVMTWLLLGAIRHEEAEESARPPAGPGPSDAGRLEVAKLTSELAEVRGELGEMRKQLAQVTAGAG